MTAVALVAAVSAGGGGRRTAAIVGAVAAGATGGIALGAAWGGGVVVLLVVAVLVVVLVVATWWPVLGVALVPVAVAFGNDSVPGAPGGRLQVVHVLVALAIGALGLHVVVAGRTRVAQLDAPAVRAVAVTAAFAGSAVLSGLVGRTPYVSMESNAMLVGAVLMSSAVVVVATSVPRLRAVLCAVVAASIAATAPALGQLDGVAASRGGSVVDNRPTGSFVDPNELGAYAVLALVLALTLAATAQDAWWERLVGVVASASASLALVVSFSRGAWLAAAAAAVCLAFSPVLRTRVLGVVGFLAAAAGAAALSGAVALPLDALGARAETIVDGTANPYDVRPFIWRTAVDTFTASPLLGTGPGSFSRAAADPDGPLWAYPVVHAHNGALTVAAENGILGLTAAAAVVVVVAAGLVRATRSPRDVRLSGPAAGLLAALIGVGASLTVDYTLRNPLLLVTVWVVVGLAIATARLARCGPTPDLLPTIRSAGPT